MHQRFPCLLEKRQAHRGDRAVQQIADLAAARLKIKGERTTRRSGPGFYALYLLIQLGELFAQHVVECGSN